QLGETVVEGTIVKWLKSEGDSVDRDEPLFEISTDKVDTEVPSPIAGTITEILVQEGETVEVGTQLAMIESGDGQAAAEGAPSEEAEEPKEQAQAGEEKAEEPPRPEPEPEPAPQPEQQPAQPERQEAQPERQPAQPAAAAERGPRSHILSPLVRRLADEHGIDLDRVQGTGTGGRITKKDIMAVVESGQPAEEPAAAEARPPLQAVPEEPRPAPAPQAAPAAAEEVRPISHIRKRIAENMVASLHQSARAWNAVEVNMERIAQLRNRAKDAFKRQEGISLTYMPFLARAVSGALLAYPDVNARLNLEEGTATYRRSVNLGVAVAYDEGLIVPIVKGAEGMNVVGLARAINDVATRARSKKLSPDEVHGGTFSITNPGPFGSLISVPIMNPGETAILAFDTVQKRPVVIDDAIAIRHMVYLSLSWDHRMIDGATAAQFLARVKENLETWDFTSEVQAYLSE
ncbi:MAG TPA: 2-oxoglutarate dehydrogenase, E2 component, dihydrolipoamide succinyltransferase, partial [Actinomycetota bacterium]